MLVLKKLLPEMPVLVLFVLRLFKSEVIVLRLLLSEMLILRVFVLKVLLSQLLSQQFG